MMKFGNNLKPLALVLSKSFIASIALFMPVLTIQAATPSNICSTSGTVTTCDNSANLPISESIIEESGAPGTAPNQLDVSNVTIVGDNFTLPTGWPSLISLAGNNGAGIGQDYGSVTLNLADTVNVSYTNTTTNLSNPFAAVYTRSDTSGETTAITSAAKIKIDTSGITHNDIYGIHAENWGGGDVKVLLQSGSEIKVIGSASGSGGQAVRVVNRGGVASMVTETGSSITTDGNKVYGIYADTDTNVYIENNGDITTNGESAHAIVSTLTGNTGTVNIINTGNIVTNGDKANGIFNNLKGETVNITNTGSITTTGDQTTGIRAINSGNGDIQINNSGSINILGNDSMAIIAGPNGANIVGDIIINNTGDITVQGQRTISTGGWATGTLPTAILAYGNRRIGDIKVNSSGNILTQSNNRGIGIFASLSGTGNVEVIASGNISTGTTVDNSSLSNTCSNYDDSCDNHGIQSANQAATVDYSGGDNYVEFSNGTITTLSRRSHGILQQVLGFTEGNAELINQGTIITHGANSDGIRVLVEGAATNIGVATITNNGTIQAKGANSSGILSSSRDGDMTVTLLSNSNIQGGDNLYGAGITMRSLEHTKDTTQEQAASQTLINYGTISAANDQAIIAHRSRINTGAGTTDITNYGNITGFVNLSADYDELDTDGVTVLNTITSTDGNATLNNNGTWLIQDHSGLSSGAIGEAVNTFGIVGNNGLLKNNGTISINEDLNYVLFNHVDIENSGIIQIANKSNAASFIPTTLEVNGNYTSNGGSLVINTLLDDATSNGGQGTSDLLIINGNVATGSGATKVMVMPTSNSLGALTTGNGIKVVQVSGTSTADAFTLGRPVTAGAYEYLLGKGSADSNWYLTSFYNPATGGGANSGHILYNPAVGAYLANQSAATEMFRMSLYDRLISSENGRDAENKHFWLRTQMTHGSNRSVHDSLSNRNRSYTLQLGGDLNVWKLNEGNLHLGIMAGYGDFENTSTSRATRTKVDGKVKGYNSGVYATWYQTDDTAKGLYVDTWSQMNWYRNEISGKSQLNTEKYNTRLWSNSAEVGYGLAMGRTVNHEWLATPQAQITYNNYYFDNQKDHNNLVVSDDKANGLVSRLGIRLQGKSIEKPVVEPFVEMNWINTTAKNQLKFNGQNLRDGLPRNRFETKVGLQGNVTEKLSIAAQVGGQWGSNRYDQYQGQLQVKYKW